MTVGLTPRALSRPRFPASPCGLHRDKSALDGLGMPAFLGLTPQAINMSRLPASPCGLRRDKSAPGHDVCREVPSREAAIDI